MNEQTTRPTETLETPAKKQLVLKSYITARERNTLRAVFGKHVEVKDDGSAAMGKMDITGIDVAEREMITAMVVSYDGITENITDTLLDQSPEEYDFVISKCNELLTANFTKSK